MDELDEQLDIVDENGKVIGQASRGEVYQKGLLHRASHILIKNSKDQIYLQKRSLPKKLLPGYWDISAAEHLKVGETFEQAAKRGLKEELGIEVGLQLIREAHHQTSRNQNNGEVSLENELVTLFVGVYDGKVRFDKEEVAEGKFFTPEEIHKSIKEKTIQFTDWFLEEWEFIKNKHILTS
ncbi:NUDIX domain-containing protein [Candidatus Daviesbacteria bacterium]|nr:NUDIX domain-containing protein [Candidatus Daviesbacteria bacterium]